MARTKKTEEAVVEEAVVESTPEVEETVVEETPKKSTRKKKTEEPKEEVVESTPEVVEEVKEAVETSAEPVVEEVKEEPAKVEEVIPEPIIEENLVELTKEEKKERNKKLVAENGISSSFTVQVVGVNGIYTFSDPSLDAPKGKVIPRGMRIGITEVKGNWGKLANGKWILLGSSVIKLN